MIYIALTVYLAVLFFLLDHAILVSERRIVEAIKELDHGKDTAQISQATKQLKTATDSVELALNSVNQKTKE